jgi:hypothetical protein
VILRTSYFPFGFKENLIDQKNIKFYFKLLKEPRTPL